ncbi:WhiB family transcriptional regulator [Streptomyces sp. NPDC056084]|uniref:WhiB family transcriptional regulator n=1 Tax=unclassified Streptomyces TaxID=2593676 RepID=UPI0035D7F1FD
MTTAVLTHPTTPADTNWARRSACTAETANDFFGTSAAAEVRARAVCRTCPVRIQCLTDRMASAPDGEGILGGLTETQRRILTTAELLGERPDLRRADELLSPRWRYRLHRLRCAALAPRRIAEILTAEGIEVDAITVRVALWWTGASGKMVARRAQGDRRPLWQRLRDDHGEVLQRLRAQGARQADGADYLGVRLGTYSRAVQELKAEA